MINVTELKRKVIDEFLTNQSSVTSTPFKSVARIYTGESTNAEEKAKYSIKTDDCYPYVSTKDISIKGSVNFENGMYIPKGIMKFSIAPVNSILLCIEGGNAGNKIAIIKEATCFVNKLCCFDIFDADNRFIYYYLLSNQFRNNFKEQMTGLIGGVSVKKLKELLLPLPDITEQKRIANKLDVIFAELDKIDEKQTRLATIQEKMESKILKLAIQGKLVEQRPDEGSGEELFKLIQEEKQDLIKQGVIKKEKPLPAIEEDEIPFAIPSTWKWVRLGEIIQIKSGEMLTSSEMKNGLIPVYGGNGVAGYHDKWLVDEETIVIGRVGFYCGSVHITEKYAWITDNAFITHYSKSYINQKYLAFVLKQLNLGGKNNGVAQPVVSGKKIYPMFFPLPPFEEQKRIVAKIEELLPLCKG